LQHSHSAVPLAHSPLKRTVTAETSELSHRLPSASQQAQRTESEDTPKSIPTQRIYYERSAGERGEVGQGRGEKQWQF
jgi:hypothetical protein